MSALPGLSIRYLVRYCRRYLFLFIALAFGFSIITFITSVKDRMTENIYFSAQAHYAGDIIAEGYDTNETHHLSADDADAIVAAARRAGVKTSRTVRRTNLFNDTLLFYNGNALAIKYLLGVDYETEYPYFSEVAFTGEDSAAPASLPGDGILVSAPVAEFLGARKGDNLLVQVANEGVANTGMFVISGVIDDSTLFGYYKAYIDRRTLNGLIGFAESDCSNVGFYLQDRGRLQSQQTALNRELAGDFSTYPLIFTRDDFEERRHENVESLRIMLLTIPVYLSEIHQLLDAMDMLSYFLYGMMLVIVFFSASVTWRLILHERRREIGTMRAIGFYEAEVRRLLLSEIFLLGLCSLIAGFLFCRFLSWGLSHLSFSWFPSFEIFMRNGRLTALYRPLSTAANGLAVFALLFLAAWFPLYNSSRRSLPEMLGGSD
ncbi:MAG: FtsX-like permease family protein [Treponema sp.]|jgi:ABC-type antimicrobial peptide transport system permease subunit|nr:FtsX-like permease family protein [Treponema sp.]